jgi:hypothetical protein
MYTHCHVTAAWTGDNTTVVARENLCGYERTRYNGRDVFCVEYLHRSPASRRRRQKGNPKPGRITGLPCSGGDTKTGTCPSRLGESRGDSKMWSWVPRTRTWEWLRWRGPAIIVNDSYILSSERMLHKGNDRKCSVKKITGRESQAACRQD